MDKKKKTGQKKSAIFIAILMITLTAAILSAGCETQKEQTEHQELPQTDFCETDDDCICGGIDKTTNRCFLGNKDHYEANVDKKKQCPDFCGGIDGNLAVKCVENKCTQMYECITDMECGSGERCINNRCQGKDKAAGCSTDKDCITGGCSGTICQSRSAEPIFTTCEMKPEYECYRMISCGCVAGECNWKTTEAFETCMDEKTGRQSK